MLFNVESRALLYRFMNAAARGPGVRGVGACGGGEGDGGVVDGILFCVLEREFGLVRGLTGVFLRWVESVLLDNVVEKSWC